MRIKEIRIDIIINALVFVSSRILNKISIYSSMILGMIIVWLIIKKYSKIRQILILRLVLENSMMSRERVRIIWQRKDRGLSLFLKL